MRQQGDKMTELLDRLEKGENITLEDLKSAFGEGNMSFVPELPPLPEFPHHSFDFSFRYSDRCDSVPGFVDEWYSQEFREEISKAMEEARKSFEKFRDVDWQIIQEEIRKSMENMRRDMDYLREKYRNEKENQPARKGISII
ncbi:MAG TPA: hypothetical protein P5320_03720 [Bacteroidales bacterium]|nr:hypothetical protein [Bacteroidales bacterium]HRR15809.1 hypothetical protein [Bacteroidales bacterium]